MARFTDATGRAWSLEIPNFRVVIRLREKTGFDLNRVGHADDGLAELVYGDAERVVRAAWELADDVPDQMTFEQFAEAIDRDALARLRLAVAEAVFDFFHPGRTAQMTARLRPLLPSPGGSTGSGGTSPASAG